MLVGDPNKMETLEHHTLADADFASCLITRRSTAGGCLLMRDSSGGPTIGCLDAVSKRLRAAAPSTGHAEVCALDLTMRKITLPAALVLQVIFGDKVHTMWVDASVVVANIQKGECSAALRYLAKFPGVNIAFISDLVHQCSGFELEKVGTADNTADIFTKPLEYDSFSKHRNALGILSQRGMQIMMQSLGEGAGVITPVHKTSLRS